MCEGSKTMTGIVTESPEEAATTVALSDVFRAFNGRSFVPFSELMTSMGVPLDAFKESSVRLRNGRKAKLTDPQMGWGPEGFGYYMTTFIQVNLKVV